MMEDATTCSSYKTCSIPDKPIIERILNGEKELFEVLLRRYNQTLYRAVRSYIKDEDDISDTMQDTYLKAFEKLSQYRGTASFSTWLIRIGINETLLRLKKVKKKKAVLIDGAENYSENKYQPSVVTSMNPEKKVIQKEMRQLMEQAIDQLPEKYRIVYMLKEIEGMEYEEIAACLGLSLSNVKVRVHRAKNLLKEKLYSLSSQENVFEFGNSKCDKLVEAVMKKIL